MPAWSRDRSRNVMDRLLDNGLSPRLEPTHGRLLIDVDFDQAHAILDEEMSAAHAVRTPANGTGLLVRSPAMSMFLLDVEREAQGAQERFPGAADKMAATTEECGELARALLQHKYGKGEPGAVYAEAVQLAAMAAQIALGGDDAFPYAFDVAHHLAFRPTGAPRTDGAAA